MPQPKTFKARGGGHVSIYVPWRPDPIEILEGGTIETDSPAELAALKACSEVEEVKQSAPAGDSRPTLRDKREA